METIKKYKGRILAIIAIIIAAMIYLLPKED